MSFFLASGSSNINPFSNPQPISCKTLDDLSYRTLSDNDVCINNLHTDYMSN